ncbi:chorismate-binding protein [Mastigocoleus sp. MO_188.B34]|uniref:chorismate-binding protein n=1 Tax=Mastigocoleus sp. MO_188.B34 TaxID=3036635 RepID=UPI002624293A|nr:chorismate-binding protein [Mastigocoleus sp. MO_188.B34]MDJ0694096.1 chorismate-binding protein [Mastigocoleus sp. MO_188.B34]
MTKLWYWRSLPLENRTGSYIFASLFFPASNSHSDLKSDSNLNLAPNSNPHSNLNSCIATLLESPYPTPSENPQLARYSICAGIPRIIDGHMQVWTPELGEILPFLENLLRQTETEPHNSANSSCLSPPSHLPFTGGWLGWLGYDLAWEIEKLPMSKTDSLPFPVAFWYEPECFAVLDHQEQELWLAASSIDKLDKLEKKLKNYTGDGRDEGKTEEKKKEKNSSFSSPFPYEEVDTYLSTFAKRSPYPNSPYPNPKSPLPHFFCSQSEYEAAVKQAQQYIRAGDIFQANLSLRFATLTAASGWEIYLALQKINPSPFASYWRTPWGEIASCSPERLVKLFPRGEAETRPIAGTRSRGETPEKDRIQARDLVSNTKEIAEHIMLVDLERNDLGRVCKWGSVVVDEFLKIERYSHVMHLVSNIKGSLKSESNAVDLIRAMFPGGTITGCPKVRCMSIIEELETVRRSLFYGSCGYLDRRGYLDLNILIRTLLLAPYDKVRDLQQKETKKKHKSDKLLNSPPVSSSQLKTSDPLDASVNTFYYCESSPWGVYEHQPSEHLHSKINVVWGQVGAGIVADSDPRREWDESLHKAQAQLAALKLLNDGS